MQIGYVGRGNMGGALAQRLACELASARGVPTRFGDLARAAEASSA
jgi:3-hydroxyisobutyrate dehydrogenase-like beta-hydroxyacid dehydrogenase